MLDIILPEDVELDERVDVQVFPLQEAPFEIHPQVPFLVTAFNNRKFSGIPLTHHPWDVQGTCPRIERDTGTYLTWRNGKDYSCLVQRCTEAEALAAMPHIKFGELTEDELLSCLPALLEDACVLKNDGLIGSYRVMWDPATQYHDVFIKPGTFEGFEFPEIEE